MMVYLCVALMIIGVVCLMAEMFITGFGVFGLAGIVSLIVAGILSVLYVPFGWVIVAAEAAVLGGLFFVLYNYMKRKQLRDSLVMSEALKEETPDLQDLDCFIGKEGVTVTALRPAGEVEIGGVRLEAASDGSLIDENSKVKVVGVRKNKVIVRILRVEFAKEDLHAGN